MELIFLVSIDAFGFLADLQDCVGGQVGDVLHVKSKPRFSRR
jgi:hypothetical protein